MILTAAAICVLVVSANAQVGPSGIVNPDGVNTQFTHEFAKDIVVAGPSGIVTKSGVNRQLTQGEATLNHGAVPAPVPIPQFVHQRGVVGNSGIVRPDGKNIQFTYAQANNFVLAGPSGIVTKNGDNIQLTDDLQFVSRAKRSLVGPSGMITADGIPIQFPKPCITVLLDGPSGYVMSDGTFVSKRPKRSLDLALINLGSSGISPASGHIIQMSPGVSIVQDRPYGFYPSGRRNTQFQRIG